MIKLKKFYESQGEKLVDDDLSKLKTFGDLLHDNFLLVFDGTPCSIRIGCGNFEYNKVETYPVVRYTNNVVKRKQIELIEQRQKKDRSISKDLLK